LNRDRQSSDPNLPRYHPGGIPLLDNYIELVGEDDELAGELLENVGKIKLYTWMGHYYIADPLTENAGVGWILAEDWWPYQRTSFVTPPFAGYVSGHSTYSRAAAEAMILLTGNEFFPGGMAEFYCKQNEFLVFENGPNVDLTLQWATYRDASDQCSLSRIWGGIHPPADDIPGRKMGITIGIDAFNYAEQYFTGQITSRDGNKFGTPVNISLSQNYPNPFNPTTAINYSIPKKSNVSLTVYDVLGSEVSDLVNKQQPQGNYEVEFDGSNFTSGIYFYRFQAGDFVETKKMILLK